LVADKGVRRFDKHQRLGWRLKLQLAGVVGVVQTQREQRAVGGRQPAKVAFLKQGAIGERTWSRSSTCTS
jgi:hypothetical protein